MYFSLLISSCVIVNLFGRWSTDEPRATQSPKKVAITECPPSTPRSSAIGTEKLCATAQREPSNISPAAAEHQLNAFLAAMAQDFAEPNQHMHEEYFNCPPDW